jgi:Fe-S oxidoreductase
VVLYFFLQKKVGEPVSYDAARRGITSKHHLWIFWGFLIIQVAAVEMFLKGISPDWSLAAILPGGPSAYRAIKFTVDWFNVLVLIMVGYGYVRRIFLRPRLIPMTLDAGLILGFIGGLMITHFLHHSFHFAYDGIPDWGEGTFSAALSHLWPQGAEWEPVAADVNWWLHIGIIFVFLNYIPYSKHIHLLGSLPNILFRNLDSRIVGTRRNLEDENDYGVGKVEQFTWKQLLDGYACTECARCSNFCPAFNTDKPLSPFHIIMDVKHEMVEVGHLRLEIARLETQSAATPAAAANGHGNDHGSDHGNGHGNGHGDGHTASETGNGLSQQIAALQKQLDEMQPLVGGRIQDEALWACTTCGACQEVCPVFIEHPRAIVDMRTHLVLAESRMPAELGRMFTNLERNSNPWGIAADRRMEWAAGLPVKTIEENPTAEYLLFVGCAGAFDDRIRKTMRSLVECLVAAKVSFAVLGREEQCSGDPSRRGGNEYLYQMQAQANVEAMNTARVTKVIASCPHCFHTIKNEYPQFGGKYEVIHHSQLLAKLIEEKRLLPTHPVARNFTFHDSCYLGRWNGEYSAPRKILESIPDSGGLIELGRRKQHGFCCGGGGARMWMEEKIGTRVNRNRTEEILATGAAVAAVACPFCTIMIGDGVKDAGAEEQVQVLDVAEVLARSLPPIKLDPNPPTPEPTQGAAESE